MKRQWTVLVFTLLAILTGGRIASAAVAVDLLVGGFERELESEGQSILVSLEIPVHPKAYLEGHLQAMAATTIDDEELSMFQSLTDQYIYAGVKYLVFEDALSVAYLGAGYKVAATQYRDGQGGEESGDYDLRGQGIYGGISVELTLDPRLFLKGDAALTWRSTFTRDDEQVDGGRIFTARARAQYRLLWGFGVEATAVRHQIEVDADVAKGTWYGLGLMYRF